MFRSAHRPLPLNTIAIGFVVALVVSQAVPATASTIVDCGVDPAALQPAIDAAPPGRALIVRGTCIGTFTITEDLTLKGRGGASLDAQGAGTTLTVSSGIVKVTGLTITGGTGTDICPPFGCGEGGGVFNRGTLTIIDSTVSGNDMDGIANFGGSVTVLRSSVSGNTARDGGGIFTANGTVTLDRSTVSGNRANGGGGGILNEDGSVFIMNSTISGNSTVDPNGGGGGILNTIFEGTSTITINNSTISGNSGAFGGGILNVGTMTLLGTTVSGNAAVEGGGIYNSDFGQQVPASTTLAASINAGNTGGDCSGSGSAVSDGYNLVGADCSFSGVGDQTVADTPSAIGIKPLANNGAKTQTMALTNASPAVDAIPVGALAPDGVTQLCPPTGTTDQRLVKRPRGPACDIGAYERKR
jgi:hypothetical protein